MRALASLPWWILLLGALALCFATVAGSRWLGRRLYGDDPMRAGGLAATLTAVFGALFAFLSGFLITTEWTQHTSAEGAVANEAAAAARLAWAADTPGVDQAKVHDAVHRYLDVSVQQDWEAMSHGLPDALPSDGTYREVERTVRQEATARGIENPSATEMLSALDSLAGGRRDRLVAADRVMPAAIYTVVLLSGLALILNSVLAATPDPWRIGRIVGLVAIVVALDLALVLQISGPFQGAYVVSSAPLERVSTQLGQGWFGPR